jgi:hypothetical protein
MGVFPHTVLNPTLERSVFSSQINVS